MTKVAFITGVNGQDGSYLSELLLEKNYIVWGMVRRASSINTQRIDHLYSNPNFILKYGDMSDSSNLFNILQEIKNKYLELDVLEIYNLAAMSHVKVSFELPEYSSNVNGLGVLRLLDAIRNLNIIDKCRFYQASTSELYGKVQEIPQTENTPFYPRSPYAVGKLFGYWMTINYREAYNMYTCNGILFNHESPRRGPTFVTRKITRALNNIVNNKLDKLEVGNLNARRDWGHAKDFVKGMWLMMQQDSGDDYVLATNEQHSVREFIELAFSYKGFAIKWKGEGLNEIGYDENTGKELVFVSEKYFRPTEVEELLGNPKKAKEKLGWSVEYSFKELVKEMVDLDCN